MTMADFYQGQDHGCSSLCSLQWLQNDILPKKTLCFFSNKYKMQGADPRFLKRRGTQIQPDRILVPVGTWSV